MSFTYHSNHCKKANFYLNQIYLLVIFKFLVFLFDNFVFYVERQFASKSTTHFEICYVEIVHYDWMMKVM